MDITMFVSAIVEHGFSNGLLIGFVVYFINRDKRRDKEIDALKDGFNTQITTILADGVRREDIMRSEAEKREQLMRSESDRRDASFTRSIDGLNDTMGKMTDGLNEMRKAFVVVDVRLQNIEGRVTGRTNSNG